VPPLPSAPVRSSIDFEPADLTTEATRIDVRRLDSSEPVLDARGPRYRPAEARAPVAAPQPQPYAAPSRVPRALGSNHAFGQPNIPASSSVHSQAPWDARGEIDRGLQVLRAIAQPELAPPSRGGSYPVRGYDMAAATNQDALVRRMIWIALVIIGAVVTLVIAAR
jgi:hypothetical protein